MHACQIQRNSDNSIKEVQAPNGKESKLFSSISNLIQDKEEAVKLWAQVYTPSFKKWFGDWEKKEGSKVVDENGEPLLVFHGSNATFNTFDKNRSGEKTGWGKDHQGIHFFENKGAAESYFQNSNDTDIKTDIFSFYLIQNKKESKLTKEEFNALEERNQNIGQVLHEYELNHFKYAYGMTYNQYSDLYKKYGKDKELINTEYEDEVFQIMDKYTIPKEELYATFLNITDPLIYDSKGKRYVQEIKDIYNKLNKDNNGIIVKNTLDRLNDSIGFEDNVFVAFEPNQIKSVFNEGEFSTTNNNIYNQEEGTEITKASVATIAKVKEFLTRNNIELKQLTDSEGKQYGINAAADLLNKLISVADGKEDVALTEEAMHFAVDMIKSKDPALFKQMMNAIGSTELYKTNYSAYAEKYKTKEGKPDVAKIKEEMVGKMLAEHVIVRENTFNEKPEILQRIEKFWEAIKNFFNKLVGKAEMNPFAEAAKTALQLQEEVKGEETFFQNTEIEHPTQEKLFNDIKTQKGVDIKKIEGKDENGKDTNWYEIAGKRVAHRVTDLAKNFYTRIFNRKEIEESDYEASINEFKRQTGTEKHGYMEHFGKVFFDENGKVLPNPIDDKEFTDSLSRKDRIIYKVLKANFAQRIANIEQRHPGSRFLQEVKIYDPNYQQKQGEVGTVDFMYITKEGKIGIFDWKFIDINTNKVTDVPWYKVKAWKLQINEYKRILMDEYGLKPEDFLDTDTKAIPILTKYKFTGAGKDVKGEAESVQIGNVDTKLEDKDYLLPIGLEEESSGYGAKVDDFIRQLNSYYDKVSEITALDAQQKREKADLLNEIYGAIRHLQIKGDAGRLTALAQRINIQADDVMAYVQSLDVESDLTTIKKSEIADNIESVQADLLMFSNVDSKLKNLFNKADPEDIKEIHEDLRNSASEARDKLEQINDISSKFLENVVAKPLGIDKLLTVERIIKGIQRLFASTSQIPIRTMQAIYKLRNDAKHRTDIAVSVQNEKLAGIEKRFMEWAATKGMTNSSKELFNLIKKQNSNQLINEHSEKFYDTLREKIKAEDIGWISSNINMEKFKEKLDELYKQELERIEYRHYGGTKEQIAKDKEFLLERAAKEYTLTHPNSYAIFTYKIVKQFPLEKWESKEFQELKQKGNEAAKEFYDYIKERNDYYSSIGYLDDRNSRVFLPYVEKTFMERMLSENKPKLLEQFLKGISIDEGTVGFGSIDPVTKEIVQTLPKYFIRDNGKEYSTDLFKTMGMYNDMAIRFKYLQDIEGQVRALARLERVKKVLNTNRFGRVQRDKITGKPEEIADPENAKLVDAMVNAIIYDQRYIASESFDAAFGKVGEWTQKINAKLGYNIFPNLEGRVLSVNKSIDTLNRLFQQQILGVHVLSSISNYLGGDFNAMINAGKYFTRSQFVASQARLFVSKLSGEDGRKIMAAMKYFLPLTDSASHEAIKDLSLNKFSQEKVQDWIMFMMRNSDKAVQNSIFLAHLDNLIIDNGEIKNAREVIRDTEWKNRYNLSTEERQKLEDAFEEKVKELVKQKGLMQQATVDEEGHFNIPGVERESESVYAVRKQTQSMSSDALGNLTEGDTRMINLNIWGKSFMVFKSWIPRLVDERFGALHYNSASEAYEMGRIRTFFSALSGQFYTTMKIALKGLALIDGTGTEEAVGLWNRLYEKKKLEYEAATGQRLEMSQAEFIDMTRQNVKAQLRDFAFYGALMALYLGAQSITEGDDKRGKALHNYTIKALDKFSDEIGFFYNPMSFQQILNGSVFPSMGVITNIYKLTAATLKESYGIVIGDEDIQNKTHPFKYLLKTVPGINQLSSYLPIFYPDIAKDLDIKMTAQSRMK